MPTLALGELAPLDGLLALGELEALPPDELELGDCDELLDVLGELLEELVEGLLGEGELVEGVGGVGVLGVDGLLAGQPVNAATAKLNKVSCNAPRALRHT